MAVYVWVEGIPYPLTLVFQPLGDPSQYDKKRQDESLEHAIQKRLNEDSGRGFSETTWIPAVRDDGDPDEIPFMIRPEAIVAYKVVPD